MSEVNKVFFLTAFSQKVIHKEKNTYKNLLSED